VAELFCSIVAPCYNERPNLEPLAAAFAAALGGRTDYELILVDNGSSDGSAAELERLLPRYPFLRAVRVEVNRGYGHGITKGLETARGAVAGWTHADLQYSPAGAVAAAESLRGAAGPVFLKGLRPDRPAADAFFTAAMALFESALFGRRLRDINAQPTLFSRALLGRWEGAPDDFALDLFAYVRALEAGFGLRRFPVALAPRRAGASSWNSGAAARLKVSLRTLRSSLHLRFR
jgi:polyisoprenyl-phosphate glycosyltransferase